MAMKYYIFFGSRAVDSGAAHMPARARVRQGDVSQTPFAPATVLAEHAIETVPFVSPTEGSTQ